MNEISPAYRPNQVVLDSKTYDALVKAAEMSEDEISQKAFEVLNELRKVRLDITIKSSKADIFSNSFTDISWHTIPYSINKGNLPQDVKNFYNDFQSFCLESVRKIIREEAKYIESGREKELKTQRNIASYFSFALIFILLLILFSLL